VPGLGASFGRGAATNYQQDLANSDCILIMGSNMAEAHPVGFRWPMKAKEKGATLIHVDPRFTRTSALCDVFVGIRAGTDIAFLGGVINYVLTNERWFKEYVLAYTNASRIIEEGFQDTEDLAGLFSGYDRETRRYNAREGHWSYQGSTGGEDRPPTEERTETKQEPGVHGYSLMGGTPAHSAPRPTTTGGGESGQPDSDPTLQHPRCVMQILQFGPVEELRERARKRVEELHRRGVPTAHLYGDARGDTYSALNSFYLLVDRPSVYGLPDEPFNPWLHMGGDYVRSLAGALIALAALAAVFLFLRP
jgi:anaerobic selenocysteine-containing dehydrogenase